MNILKTSILILVTVFAMPSKANDEASTSSWFVGVGVNSDMYGEENTASGGSNTDGFELHAGYQVNNYLKLIVGYKKFGTSEFDRSDSRCQNSFMGECIGATIESDGNLELDSFFIKLRPEWKFANNFKLYADLGINSLDFDLTSSAELTGAVFTESFFSQTKQTSTKFSWGFGVGYNLGQHELTLGFENYGTLQENGEELLIDSSVLSSFSLQYYFHF